MGDVIDSIHPFFYSSATKESLHDDTRSAPTKTPHDIFTPKTTSRRATSRSKASDLALGDEPPPSELPTYSYKDYVEQKPVVVYTNAEDEANELVDSLKPG
jgi:hypothetical protein